MPGIETAEIWQLVIAGLVAGLIGGLMGVGGSIIIIPVLTLALGHDQHLSQAAAMIVNVFVATLALSRHHRARAVRWNVMLRMLPAGVVCMIVGVIIGNQFDGATLRRIFGVFLLVVFAVYGLRIFQDRGRKDAREPDVRWIPVGVVGGLMGFFGGLLGIGGGPIAVPLLQRICELPVRQAIATSSAVMCVTSLFGAVQKNMALGSLVGADGKPLNLDYGLSLSIALCIAPTAMIGAFLGAGFAHALPERLLRAAFMVLLLWVSLQMFEVL
jgi:hypothetical protein